LRSEVESRRQSTDWDLRAGAGRPQAQDIALGRWSFGGGGTIEVAEGELTLGILIAGPEGASLEASLAVAEAVASARQSQHWVPELRDVTVTDDQGSTCTVHTESGYGDSAQPRRFEAACAVDPVPAGGSRWLDVRGRDASVSKWRQGPGQACIKPRPLAFPGRPARRSSRRTKLALFPLSG
jgi:hypothetical protein